jgi:hypothetical protein
VGQQQAELGKGSRSFTEEEEELYQSLFKDVKRKFNTYADEGTVLNNYSPAQHQVGQQQAELGKGSRSFTGRRSSILDRLQDLVVQADPVWRSDVR